MEGILSVESHNLLESHNLQNSFLVIYWKMLLSFTTKNIFNDLAANKLIIFEYWNWKILQICSKQKTGNH